MGLGGLWVGGFFGRFGFFVVVRVLVFFGCGSVCVLVWGRVFWLFFLLFSSPPSPGCYLYLK